MSARRQFLRRLAALPALGWVTGLAAPSALLTGSPTGAAEKFTSLYNGKDLAGWHIERGKLECWQANGEMISCVKNGGGYLATDQEYGDFELRLEYRIPPGGNSGIGLRFPPGGWPSTDAMEIQILDDPHPKYAGLDALHQNGAIYTHSPAKVATAARPAGEWNRMVIRCQGPQVVIHLNQVEIQNVNLDNFADSLGKGKVALAKRPRRGLIGLQCHGERQDFRKVEIRQL